MEEHSSLEKLAFQKKGVDEFQTDVEVDEPEHGPQVKDSKIEYEVVNQAVVEKGNT